MKKIVITLEKFSSCEDVYLLNNKDVDFEYLLRYMEIFKDDLISKYRSNFSSKWETKLKISFILMYKCYLESNDIRIFNMIYKNKNIVKKLKIYYKKNKMFELIVSSLKIIKHEK